MRNIAKFCLSLLVALSITRAACAEEKAAAPASTSTASPAASATKAAAPAAKAVLLAPSELNWADVPQVPGGKMAVVKGNPEKGSSQFFMKFPAGFSAPLHHHSSDHEVTLLSGTLSLGSPGKAEKKLIAGSYFAFTGKMKHTTTCDAGADCVMFVNCRGKWDVVIAGAKR